MTKSNIFKILYFFVSASLILLTSSCNVAKYLKDGDSILKETKIVFKSSAKIYDKKSLESELLTFIPDKPNGRILFFIPKEWIYLRNSEPGDTSWVAKGMRSLGEKPNIYSESKSVEIAKNMENYLRFKKGYYAAKVDFIVDEHRRLNGFQSSTKKEVWESNHSNLSFIISLGDRYTIKNLKYQSADKAVLQFVESIKNEAIIRRGDYVDYAKFELEKNRITLELQNHGYANFSANYFEFVGDSSQVTKSIDITVDIKTPLPDSTHQRFVTGKLNVFTDYYRDQEQLELTKDSVDGMTFLRQSKKPLVKESLLRSSIFLRPGQELRREDRQRSFRKLNSLGTYRFVTISPEPAQDSIMNFNILLTPYAFKWIFDGGLDVNYSTSSIGKLLGFTVSSTLQNRNLFGGSERYSLKAELGTALSLIPFTQRTRNISIQNTLNIPSFQDFLGLGKLAWKSGVIKDKFYKNFVDEANTNIELGYSASNIIDFYSLNSLNASYGFDYTSTKGNRYEFRPLGFNLNLYSISNPDRFANNPLILLSFKDILSTGFLFRDFSYVYNGQKSKKGNSFLAINNLEISGWEVFLTNELYNSIANSSKEWFLRRGPTDSIFFAKYIRYEFDGRYNKEYSKTSSFASRLNFGIIIPFGRNAASPFIKQFGVGGPNSLRAWNIREPGPGGYIDPQLFIKEAPSIFVNQGDIKIEANAEYRFKIFLILDGALFVDAGNVWTLRTDPNRPKAVFTSQFLDQIAVAAGYGLRLNFDFFNIRFDCGFKIRSPYKLDNVASQWYSFKEIRAQGILGNVQVAVNYPF